MADMRSGADALPQIPDVSGKAEEARAEIARLGTAIGNTQVAQNKSLPPEEWTGAAADAASAEIKVLGEKTENLASIFPRAAAALSSWSSAVSDSSSAIVTLQRRWDAEVSAYKQSVANIEAQYSQGDPSRRIQLGIARDQLESAQKVIQAKYDSVIVTLNELAKSAASEVDGARQEIVPDNLKKQGRGALAAALFGSDTPILDGAAEWSAAQDSAKEMLRDLEEAANSKEPLTAEQVQALQDKWGEKLKNPYYVQAVAAESRRKHGGDGVFSDMLNKLAINAAGERVPDEDERATRNSLTNSLGTAMVLSTGGVDASAAGLETSESYAKVKDALLWGDGKTTVSQIEQANIADFIATGEKEYKRFNVMGSPIIRGYDILTQATGYAAAKNPDLAFGRAVYEGGDDSLAAKLVKYDYDYRRGLATQIPADQANMFSIVNYTNEDQLAFDHCRDPLQALYELSDTPDSMQAPWYSREHPELAIAEQDRLGSVRNFMMQDTPFELNGDWDRNGSSSAEKISMVRYLTGNRGDADYRGFIDGGDSFGKMIEDMTSPLDGETKTLLGDPRWKETAVTQASIVGNYVAGYQDGLDLDGEKVGDEDAYGAKNPKLRSHTGMILGKWAESLALMDDDAANPTTTAAGSVREGRVSSATGQATFSLAPGLRDSLYKTGGLLNDLAYDNPEQIAGKDTPYTWDDKFVDGRPPALNALEAGAYGGFKEDLKRGFAGTMLPGESASDNITASVNKWGHLLAQIESASADKTIAHHATLASRNEMIRQGIDVLADAVPFGKLPGPKIVEAMASGAFDGAKNTVLDSVLPTDFSEEDLKAQVNSNYKANALVADTLAEEFVRHSDWPNALGKTKEELISEFMEEEAPHRDGVKLTEDGKFPPYRSLTEEQRVRFRDFLSDKTQAREGLRAAKETTWEAFLDKQYKL